MSILILCAIIVILIFLIIILGCKELVFLTIKIRDCSRTIITANTGLFTLIFLFIFFLEQILLIIFVFRFSNVPTGLQKGISIFALIVVTTATLQKFIWEYKYQQRSKEVAILSYQNNELISEVEMFIDEKLEKKR